MDIKTKIFKRNAGKSKGKWIVRIEYFDEILGKKRGVERLGERKTDVIDERDNLIKDIEKTHGQVLTGERMTFENLADICERLFYQPATIVEGRKIAGVRSHKTAKFQLTNLKAFFGKRLIRQITTEALSDYKLWRLKSGSANKSHKQTKEIKIATVNKELSSMRRIMRFAYGKGWILKDIFFDAKVIDTSAEMERTRLLTFDEENRLLNACQGERVITYERKKRGKADETEEINATHDVDNPHLKAIILIALDSGLRRGEILKLGWKDIDFENNLITVLGTNTKTERERIAPLSQRTKDELLSIQEITTGDKPFPFTTFRRSFETAKRLAKIDDLHFHDLRRTCITRWIQQGTPLAFAGKFAGHSQLQTTMKHYTVTDKDMIKDATEKMNVFHSQNNPSKVESKMLN